MTHRFGDPYTDTSVAFLFSVILLPVCQQPRRSAPLVLDAAPLRPAVPAHLTLAMDPLVSEVPLGVGDRVLIAVEPWFGGPEPRAYVRVTCARTEDEGVASGSMVLFGRALEYRQDRVAIQIEVFDERGDRLFEAERIVDAPALVRQDDLLSTAHELLEPLFAVIEGTAPLAAWLDRVVERPSAWSVFTHGGVHLMTGLDFSDTQRGTTPCRGLELAYLGATISANSDLALTARLYQT